MILAQREAFGSSPEKCGSSGSLLDVTLTFGLTFPNALHGLGSKSLRSYSQVDFGSELSSLQRCLELRRTVIHKTWVIQAGSYSAPSQEQWGLIFIPSLCVFLASWL